MPVPSQFLPLFRHILVLVLDTNNQPKRLTSTTTCTSVYHCHLVYRYRLRPPSSAPRIRTQSRLNLYTRPSTSYIRLPRLYFTLGNRKMQSACHVCGTTASYYDAADNFVPGRVQSTCLLCNRPFCEYCGNQDNTVVCDEDHEKYYAEHPEIEGIYPTIRVRIFSLQHKQRCSANFEQDLLVGTAPTDNASQIESLDQGERSLPELLQTNEMPEERPNTIPSKPVRSWEWRPVLTHDGVMMVKCELSFVQPRPKRLASSYIRSRRNVLHEWRRDTAHQSDSEEVYVASDE